MASNPNFNRMVQPTSGINPFVIQEWEDLPPDILARFPSLRPWNDTMRERFQLMQDSLSDVLKALQK